MCLKTSDLANTVMAKLMQCICTALLDSVGLGGVRNQQDSIYSMHSNTTHYLQALPDIMELISTT